MHCIFCHTTIHDGQFVVVFKWGRVVNRNVVEEKDVHDEVTDAVSCGSCIKKLVIGKHHGK